MLCEKRTPYYNQPISAINCCNIGDRKVPPFPHRYDKSLVLLSWPTEWPESRGPSQRELLCSHAETHPQGPSSLPVVTRENINHLSLVFTTKGIKVQARFDSISWNGLKTIYSLYYSNVIFKTTRNC